MTRGRKILIWVLGLVAILIILPALLIALAPTLLSTGPARSLILSRVNRRIPGEITAGDWSISWRHGVSAEQITYVHEDKGINVCVERFELPVALTTLLSAGPKDLGTVTVTRPEISVPTSHLPTRQRRNRRRTDQLQASGEKQEHGQSNSSVNSKTGASRFTLHASRRESLTAQFQVIDGSVTISNTNSQQRLAVRDLSITAELGDSGESIEASMSLADGGTVVVTTSRERRKAGLNASVHVNDLELSQLEVLMDPSRGPARAFGTMQLTASVVGEGGEYSFAGSLQGDSLKLSGGKLGDDEPELERVSLSIGGHRNADSLTITNAVTESSLGRTRLSLALKKHDERFITSGIQFTADLDAGAVGTQFRDMLSIPSRVSVTGGRFVADSKLATVNDMRQFYGAFRLTGLGVTVDDRALPHLSPASLVVSAVESSDEFTVDRLALDSPCVSFSSTGRLYNCSTDMDLQVGCRAVYDLDRTDAFMEAFTGEEFDVSGEKVAEFEVDTPLRGKSWLQILMVFLTSAWN